MAPLGTARVACEIPPLTTTGEEPRVTPPSWKVTVPVGAALCEDGALTVAVKTIVWPVTDGLALETTALVVVPLPTVRQFGPPGQTGDEELLLAKLVSAL